MKGRYLILFRVAPVYAQPFKNGFHRFGVGGQRYPFRNRRFLGVPCGVDIAALPLDKRDIILLSYFLDMSDNEIAKLLNMVRSSVAYRRTSTLKLLKELMGGNTDDT